jgi:hypothetical protein
MIQQSHPVSRALAAAWTAANPILSSGALGLETDTGKIKVGDGSLPWTALPYLAGDGEGGGGGPVAVPSGLSATGTASNTTFLRGDGTWATPPSGEGGGYTDEQARDAIGAALVAGSGISINVNDGADSITIAATGGGGGGTTVAVVTSTAGVWPSRPTADLVFWVAGTDTAATTPGAATGDDVVILAQDPDLSAIAALESAANRVPYATGAGTWALTDFTATGRTLVGSGSALAAAQSLRTAPATVTGTTDTLAAGDDNTVILYTSASAKTVTLADIATGFECVLVNLGAGALTVASGGMSFANSFTPNLTVAQGESLYVKQTAASTFIVVGGTAT